MGGNFFRKFLLTILFLTYTRVIYCFSFPRERKLNALADCILNTSRGSQHFKRVAASVFLTFVGEQVLLFVVV